MTGPLTVRVIPDDVVRRANLDYLDPADVDITAFGDEWIAAGIMGRLEGAACDGYDRMIGLMLSDVSVDGSACGTACGGFVDVSRWQSTPRAQVSTGDGPVSAVGS